jgi:4-hydroxybenzoyl-CoA reductase subunit alpha
MTIYPHGTTINNSLKKMSEQGIGVGERLPKIDAMDKLMGRIRYTDDIKLNNMVHGKIVRSPHPHARILAIDTSSVLKLKGVLDVIVGADLPIKYGVIPWTKDEYPLALDKARYVGDAVAAVIAETPYDAHQAALKLRVDYEVLPAILNVAQAKNEPTHKVNEHAKVGNITKEVDLSFGDVDELMAQSDVVMAQDFSFHNTTHAPIEPHAAIADFSPSGLLTVYSSTQVPHYLHRSLAEVLNMPSHQIRVIQPPVGGAFGGKSEPFDLEFVVAIASMRQKRPVKILYTREEVFLAHRGRHPMIMSLSMGAKQDGTIMAVRNLIDIDGGAYASFGMITAFYAGQLLTGPVGMKSYHFHATRYYTNKPACGPKRGHGSVQPRFAYEILCDMMAEKLSIDPITLRIINTLKDGSTTINGQKIGSLGIVDVLEQVAKKANWAHRRGNMGEHRGLGVACSMYISGTNYPVYPNDMPQSSVSVRLDRSGRVHITSGASDIGQGSNSILAQIALEELGVKPGQISVITGDTDLCPVDLGAYSSRITVMAGLAAQEALRKARMVLAEAAVQVINNDSHLRAMAKRDIEPDELSFKNNRLFVTNNPEVALDFTKVVHAAESHHGSLVFTGDYRTAVRGGDYRGGSIGASPAYSCTAHIADVSVDIETGRLKIHQIYVAHDCGQAINPDLVEGQMEGSTYMGAAEVVLERFITDESDGARQGMLIGPSLLDYRIPTTLDTPDITAIIVEKKDPNGPYGAKEAGEGPLHSAIPAIANAIYDAVKIRLFSLPFSPQKILKALAEKNSQSG